MTILTFAQIRAANLSRCTRWHGAHGVHDWNTMEWSAALCGEAGELANVAKKLKRVESGIAQNQAEYQLPLIKMLGQEAADVLAYLDLTCASRGIDLEAEYREKFNAVSIKYGFPERV
jgi:NTP pyrophosphatase (non-canonical NTP hydrolase)